MDHPMPDANNAAEAQTTVWAKVRGSFANPTSLNAFVCAELLRAIRNEYKKSHEQGTTVKNNFMEIALEKALYALVVVGSFVTFDKVYRKLVTSIPPGENRRTWKQKVDYAVMFLKRAMRINSELRKGLAKAHKASLLARNELNEVQKNLEESLKEQRKTRDILDVVEKKKDGLEDDYNNKDFQLHDAREELRKERSKIDALRRVLKRSSKPLEKDIETLLEGGESFRHEGQSLLDKRRSLHGQLESLQAQLNTAAQTEQALLRHLETAQKVPHLLKQGLTTSNERETASMEENLALRKQVKELQQGLDNARQRSDNLDAALELCHERKDDLERSFQERLRVLRNDQKRRLDEQEHALQKALADAEEKQKRIDQQDQEMHQAQRHFAEQQQRIIKFEQALQRANLNADQQQQDMISIEQDLHKALDDVDVQKQRVVEKEEALRQAHAKIEEQEQQQQRQEQRSVANENALRQARFETENQQEQTVAQEEALRQANIRVQEQEQALQESHAAIKKQQQRTTDQELALEQAFDDVKKHRKRLQEQEQGLKLAQAEVEGQKKLLGEQEQLSQKAQIDLATAHAELKTAHEIIEMQDQEFKSKAEGHQKALDNEIAERGKVEQELQMMKASASQPNQRNMRASTPQANPPIGRRLDLSTPRTPAPFVPLNNVFPSSDLAGPSNSRSCKTQSPRATGITYKKVAQADEELSELSDVSALGREVMQEHGGPVMSQTASSTTSKQRRIDGEVRDRRGMNLSVSSTPSTKREHDGEGSDEEPSTKKRKGNEGEKIGAGSVAKGKLDLAKIPKLARPKSATGPRAKARRSSRIPVAPQPTPLRKSARNVVKPESYNVKKLTDQASTPVKVDQTPVRRSLVRSQASRSPTKRSPRKR